MLVQKQFRVVCIKKVLALNLLIYIHIYRTRAIITRGLYIFYPIFHCGLYCRAVSVTDNLCTKPGNSAIFGFKIRGLQLRAVSNLERVIMARVWQNILQTALTVKSPSRLAFKITQMSEKNVESDKKYHDISTFRSLNAKVVFQ